ncbi:PREDICTED: LOW QUALITY PROTEIN: uncharacterized protein KIAA1958-like [Branchiostoma belcheri]|uniref:LOW QUALITY PROTEIN: uncharacterized protein KIAA1958-like n=1 Tax=Branchiostoma belcheri TaxID=7741 RepID=A0A6P4YBQ6_BRABE|nr:PREDICTED: LOW QUALITY PROTEIN: uncharacterized protein KIAA1958-like [Branchiostoma belcheri]
MMAASDRAIVFQDYDYTESSSYIDQQKNYNTKKKTASDARQFVLWLEAHGDKRRLEDILPEELDGLLGSFFLGIKKDSGEDYEPDSLTSKQRSIARYLKEKGYPVDIISDRKFAHSRECLLAKRKSLKKDGKGNRPNRADPLSQAEIKLLEKKQLIGPQNPDSLIAGLWLNNTRLFGMRSRQEHCSMLWGDVEETVDSQGRAVLEYSERATKTRTGATSDTRPFRPRAYACPERPSVCPVNLYREYRKRRPMTQMHPTAPFYLGINQARKCDAEVWFINSPMGKNKIGNIMSTMAGKGGLSGRKVNHSARKTMAVQTLVAADLPPTRIVQLSGHKNLQSVNSYSCATEEQQKEMSDIIMGKEGSASHASAPVCLCQQQQLQCQQKPSVQISFAGATIQGGTWNFGGSSCSA